MSTFFVGHVTDAGDIQLTVKEGVWTGTSFCVSNIHCPDADINYEEDGVMYSDLYCDIDVSSLKENGLDVEYTEDNSDRFKQWLRISLGKFVEDALVSFLSEDADEYK